MARSRGANATLLLGFESTYGTPPTVDADYFKMPFVSSDLDDTQELEQSQDLGEGRETGDPSLGVITVEGAIKVPVDQRNIGLWLKLIFGAPTTTGSDAPYTHTYKGGAATLPSASIEVGQPDVPDFPTHVGCKGNSIKFDWTRSGQADVEVQIVAQGAVEATSSRASTPSELAKVRFSQFQGSIKDAGTQVANVTAASLTYSNNLDKVETIRADGKIDGADPALAALTGSITMRYADKTYINKAKALTPVDLEFAYTVDADTKLVITCPRVFLPKPKRSISGPGGVELTYDFNGAKDATEGTMIVAELLNDVDSYA